MLKNDGFVNEFEGCVWDIYIERVASYEGFGLEEEEEEDGFHD